MRPMWKVNAGRRSVLAGEFLSRGVVAIGWREAGDYSGARSRSEVLQRVAAAYPDHTDQQNHVGAGQVWRFLDEVTVGDSVLTYDPATRLYHLGEIIGPPRYAPDQIEALPVQRAVQWTAAVSRDALSQAAKGRLGAILTLFKVADETVAEIMRLADGNSQPLPTLGDSEDQTTLAAADPFAELEDQAIERIKDRLLALDWEEMQELVAALLRALGYRTIVSPVGADRGKDIIASRDGFGFERPRIVVEVKHRKGAMGAQEIRSFLGGRHADDRGLYVSTGGFTKDALYEAERASTVTHLMTLDGLAEALINQYDQLDERGRRLLPLRRIYWPA
ncbi:MAG TPA: restriction endonuclease [Allosphingosinicella sp.]|uniref:restriction endonuclease n=1 Tax=Allosphingosinicella sp. TaxID=2823234 RepID=UPI002EDABC11